MNTDLERAEQALSLLDEISIENTSQAVMDHILSARSEVEALIELLEVVSP